MQKTVRRSGTTTRGVVVKNYYRFGGSTTSPGAVLPLARGAVLPLDTETALTFAYGLRIQRNQVCWKANDMG